MNKFLMIGLISVITGCSVIGAKYDANEYSTFTRIAAEAMEAKQVCGNQEQVRYYASRLRDDSAFAIIYTKYESYNEETFQMATEIKKMVDELNVSVDKGNMSQTFCSIKLDIIQQSAETAMRSSASKRNQ
jgi:hypothetical protein